MSKQPVKQDKSLNTSEIMKRTLHSLTEGITGIASTDRKEIALSIGHILQHVRTGKFLQSLMDEWNEYREKGKIKDDYFDTSQHQDCLQEMLDFLEKDIPDEARFNFLKQIFICISTESIESRESALPYQLMKIARRLSAGSIVVLSAAYKISLEDGRPPDYMERGHWLEEIVEITGLKHIEVLYQFEEELINSNLIFATPSRATNMVATGEYNRLTGLGYELCQYIKSYDQLDDE